MAAQGGRPLGPTRVVHLERAPARYWHQFSPRFGTWLRAWTRELATECRIPESAFADLLAEWEADRMSSSVLESAVADGG
jgi:hypothetical protein